ncbi:hypothetical protein [Actinoplanes subtropicus]|uniref:hypothetical protein n=1 Tax=Actinoplanes subtropicus TaxID=543632 RepID=UPI0012FA7242|nr:hypothetical protein [Actinoplanes subtropicus]
MNAGSPSLIEVVVSGRLELVEFGEQVVLAALQYRDVLGNRGRVLSVTEDADQAVTENSDAESRISGG